MHAFFPPPDIQNAPGFLLIHVTHLWQKELKKILKPYKLTQTHFVIMTTTLWLHHQNMHPTQRMLTKWTAIDEMTISKALKKLQQDFLLIKGFHQDSRAKGLRLTLKGKKLLEILMPTLKEAEEKFFGEAAPACIDTLKNLTNHLNKQEKI